MKTEYPSRVDSWLAIILIGAPLVVIATGIFMLSKSVGAGVITMITGVVVGGMIAALTLPCVYTLNDDNLKIKSGMLEDDVPLRKVIKAEKCSSLWSAPALSLQRVRIILEDGSRIISPKDQDKFMADLETRLSNARKG